MDSATVVARFWNPFTGGYTVAKTRRRSFPISCKLPFKFTGFYQSDRRGVLSTIIPRAKETEFTFPPEYYDDVSFLPLHCPCIVVRCSKILK